MAMPPCMSGDGREAVFVGTMLQTGDAVALCDECLVPWAAAVLNAMTGIDAAPFLAAISTDSGPAAGPVPPDTGDDDGDDDDERAWALAEMEARAGGPPPPGPADADPGAVEDDGGMSDSDPEASPTIGRTRSGYPVGRTQPARSSGSAGTGGGGRETDK